METNKLFFDCLPLRARRKSGFVPQDLMIPLMENRRLPYQDKGVKNMKKQMQRVLAGFLAAVMLVGLLPLNLLEARAVSGTQSQSQTVSEPAAQYKVEIVSYIRGAVEKLRCSELLEARIYKSVDNAIEVCYYTIVLAH